ncbi:uncharacterized protein LOC127700984 [Mytilus californianus]|uniref:uncharacterized protein LOC127700984 n=1 Tax=Mytilus californianus TaxID=6549 RepID=UPI002247B348|nr:uncharacterized protein LOC127700984 [Mytilus californianus]
MGVLEIPSDETALRQEVETFIDDNGKIDMQAMKDKGYMEDQIYDIMNAYFLATARVLAAYRRDRKAQDTMLKFLHDKVQLQEEKILCADKYMSYLCDVKSTQEINNNLYTKVEDNVSRCSDKEVVYDENSTDEGKPIRHSPSAPELSPSKYFNSFSVESNVKESKSSHNICPDTIENTSPNEKEESVEIIRRVPTPYPNVRKYGRFPKPSRNSSFVTELVSKKGQSKQAPQSRKTVTHCNNTGQLKTVINKFEDVLGLSAILKNDDVSLQSDLEDDRSEYTLSNEDVITLKSDHVTDRSKYTLSNDDITLENGHVDDRSKDTLSNNGITLESGHVTDRSKDTLSNDDVTLESGPLDDGSGNHLSIARDASSSVSSCFQDYVKVNVDDTIGMSPHTSSSDADSRTDFQSLSHSTVNCQKSQSQKTIVSESSCFSSVVARLQSSSLSVQVSSDSSNTHSRTDSQTLSESTVDYQSNQSQTTNVHELSCFSSTVTRLKSSSVSYKSAPPMFTSDRSLQRSFSSESHKMSHFSIECVRIHQSMSLADGKINQSDVSIFCGNDELQTNSQCDISQTSNVESRASENSDESSD